MNEKWEANFLFENWFSHLDVDQPILFWNYVSSGDFQIDLSASNLSPQE